MHVVDIISTEALLEYGYAVEGMIGWCFLGSDPPEVIATSAAALGFSDSFPLDKLRGRQV